jgi:hypothetical protein
MLNNKWFLISIFFVYFFLDRRSDQAGNEIEKYQVENYRYGKTELIWFARKAFIKAGFKNV